jgi:HD-GYP domain-containing protein (c-di-GMP phosphodiesterase class II)
MVLVCERCSEELSVISTVEYSPRPRRFVGHLAELTAIELGLAADQVARVRIAAMVCDVGRDQIPADILNKRGPLTPAEWVQIRRQPEIGATLLCDASFDDIRAWVLARRERLDGRGYPHGLRGEEIPLEARILAVAEAYVAMTTPRAYAPTYDHTDAISELHRCAGTQFDPTVVEAFDWASVRRALPLARAAA